MFKEKMLSFLRDIAARISRFGSIQTHSELCAAYESVVDDLNTAFDNGFIGFCTFELWFHRAQREFLACAVVSLSIGGA